MNEENVEVNAVDALASEYGWKPEGKKSASDYIKFALEKLPERGEALSAQSKTIEAKESELSMMKATLEELSGHMKKQKEVAYNEAMAAFKEQKRQAILNGDVDAVDALEASIAPQQEEKHEVHPSISAFEEANSSWLNGDSYEELEMQDWVERHGMLLGKKQLPPEVHMKRLEQDLHKKFPAYFEAEAEEDEVVHSSVESAGGSSVAGVKSNNKKYTFANLSDTQKQVAKYLQDSGHMKIEEYIKELVSLGDLK